MTNNCFFKFWFSKIVNIAALIQHTNITIQIQEKECFNGFATVFNSFIDKLMFENRLLLLLYYGKS